MKFLSSMTFRLNVLRYMFPPAYHRSYLDCFSFQTKSPCGLLPKLYLYLASLSLSGSSLLHSSLSHITVSTA